MRSTQTNLFDYFETGKTRKRYGRTQHGGATSNGHRKLERPLSAKKWIHLILKSDKAKGKLSFLVPKNEIFIQKIIKEKARKFGVVVADQANVGNHLHLKIRITSRESFQKFLKAITTLIARQITGARKGRPFGRFWQGLAFTRVLTSRTEELNLMGYIMANRLEAATSTAARDKFLRRFNSWVYRERLRGKELPKYSSA
jgi:hypothetical protein